MLLVILFHAGLAFPGGYVGVDVFFVISGYLITGGILNKQVASTFSLLEFYVRRIRRIVPASAVSVAVTLVAGWFLLLPSDYQELAESAVAQQCMVANVFFWMNTGYFDGPADLKPLLHHWSLAVEEQFYLIYPLLLMFLAKQTVVSRSIFLGIAALASLVVSEWLRLRNPEAAFFLLPSRAWELIIGGALWWLPQNRGCSRIVCEIIGWAGMSLVLGASLMFDSASSFPGVFALLPCVGAVAVIYSSSDELCSVGWVLSRKPVVFIGIISYSLYLWHWPVFVFAAYHAGNELSYVTRLLLVGLVFFVSVFSWRYVEKPFRSLSTITCFSLKPTKLALQTCAVLVLASCFIVGTSGATFRFSAALLQFDQRGKGKVNPGYDMTTEDAVQGALPGLGVKSGANGKVAFMVWGDSHARALAVLINKLATKHGICGVLAAKGGTPPFLGSAADAQHGSRWNNAILSQIRSNEIRHVILVGRWTAYFQENDMEARLAFGNACNALSEMPVKIWLINQVPEQSMDPNLKLWKSAWLDRELPFGISSQQHQDQQRFSIDVLQSCTGEQVALIDPSGYCIDDVGRTLIGDENGSYYFDENHLSNYGADVLLKELFDEVLIAIKHDVSLTRSGK